MKKVKAMLAVLLMLSSAFAATACGDKSSSGEESIEGTTLDEERANALLEAAGVTTNADGEFDVNDAVMGAATDGSGIQLTGELSNKTIKWFSFWDINPDATGKSTPADLYLFQQIYGGNVEYIQCTWANRYEKLASSITAGEGADFFPAGDLDAFPKGAVSGMFTSYDDYIDLDSPLWEDVKDVNDSLVWNGKHYLAISNVTGDRCAVLYNRKTVQEAGLEDPAQLYADGEWNWNTFEDMITSFVDFDNNHYGVDGWWYEFGLMNTIGVPPIGVEDGKLVSHLADPSMERVQNWMYDLYTKHAFLMIETGEWKEHPEYIGEGKTLFYPVGLYELYSKPEIWQKTYGEDVFFVPMPRDPEADEYYIPVGMDAVAFISGGQNPEGVAKYLDCKRFVLLNEDARSVADEALTKDYGWTQEMVDMKDEMQRLAEENPFFDFTTGVSKDCTDILDGSLRLAGKGTPWNETFDSINSTVESYVKAVNDNPVAG